MEKGPIVNYKIIILKRPFETDSGSNLAKIFSRILSYWRWDWGSCRSTVSWIRSENSIAILANINGVSFVTCTRKEEMKITYWPGDPG